MFKKGVKRWLMILSLMAGLGILFSGCNPDLSGPGGVNGNNKGDGNNNGNNGNNGGGDLTPDCTLSGVITLNGQGVEGVSIKLVGSKIFNLTTDSEGCFGINSLPAGEYRIETEKSGLTIFPDSYNRRFTLTRGGGKDLKFSALNGTVRYIYEIQQATHYSSLNGQNVTDLIGVVTAIASNKFYIQNVDPDESEATSEGLTIFSGSKPSVKVGDLVLLSGKVSEYYPGKREHANLSITQLYKPSYRVIESGRALPEPIVIGKGGRVVPGKVCSDSEGEVKDSPFNPAVDAIDFYESLEGMRVALNDALVVSPTSRYNEFSIIPDKGEGAELMTARGGILLREQDYNTEWITVDDYLLKNTVKPVTGDIFNGAVVGVLDYSFGSFKLNNTQPLPTLTAANNVKEVTALRASAKGLTIAAYNVENYSAVNSRAEADSIAADIINRLGTPDIVCLIEVMDNNGTAKGVTDASETYKSIFAAIEGLAVTNPYDYREIAPAENSDGGIPGGNIRCGFIFNSSRVSFVDRAGGTATSAISVSQVDGKAQISFSPGRIEPSNSSFAGSRKPLVGEFLFNGEKIYIVNNHFKSKGGDNPIWGRVQPPVRKSEIKRGGQAEAVSRFVKAVLAAEPGANLIVTGDLNDFEFSQAVKTVAGSELTNLLTLLPEAERYSYIYGGNSQVLDHMLVSAGLMQKSPEFDIVHINSEYNSDNRSSDHDPLVARFSF